MRQFDDFVTSRDKDFTLSNLYRVQLPLNLSTCIWTTAENYDKITATAVPEEVVARKELLDELNNKLSAQTISITGYKSSITQLKSSIAELNATVKEKDKQIEDHISMKESLQESVEGLEQNNFDNLQKAKAKEEVRNERERRMRCPARCMLTFLSLALALQELESSIGALKEEKDILEKDLKQQIQILQEEMEEQMKEKEADFLAERNALEDNLDASNKIQQKKLEEKEKTLQKQQEE